MSYFPGLERLVVYGVNAKTVAVSSLGTTRNNSQKFVPMYAVFHCTAAFAITVACTISIGTNVATYNNIMAATMLTGVTAAGNMLIVPLGTTAISVVNANTAISANLSVAATGTSQTIDIELWGFYK